jgi:superfamily II DNA/RNA helicase
LHVLDAATSAASDEPKIAALRRLLRRTGEPVIVFTEYRDTLNILEYALGDLRQIVTLHGGKTPQERREAVDAFTRGSAGLLLATDAGAEGLNLHERCRLVVNLELPWSPIRLEQRIGRVDRLGQARAVHAINLLAGNTAEASVLARLATRMDRIYASEIEVAASVIGRAEMPTARTDGSVERPHGNLRRRALARAEAMRIQAATRRPPSAAVWAGMSFPRPSSDRRASAHRFSNLWING